MSQRKRKASALKSGIRKARKPPKKKKGALVTYNLEQGTLEQLLAAKQTDATIIPITSRAHRAWIFSKAWDRYLLPKPFARGTIVLIVHVQLVTGSHEDITAYKKLTDRIAGGLFAYYFKLIEMSNEFSSIRLSALGYNVGCWLQIRNDIDSQDPRVECVKKSALDWQKELEVSIAEDITLIGDPVWGIHEMVFPDYGIVI